MGKEIVIYKLNGKDRSLKLDIDYKSIIWKPSFSNICPPNKNYKYIIYWMFYYLNIFSNKNYCACLVYDNETLISSLLVVPNHFKWPFMGKSDVQFTYVMVHPDYRGQGLAGKMIKKMVNELKFSTDYFWYVTDTKNKASIRVAEKLGFTLVSKGERKGILKVLKFKD